MSKRQKRKTFEIERMEKEEGERKRGGGRCVYFGELLRRGG